MTGEILYRLLQQIDALRSVSSSRAPAGAAAAAIRKRTREIERLAEGDLAADYAKAIRASLGPRSSVSRALVNEQIEHLVAYALIVSVAFLNWDQAGS